MWEHPRDQPIGDCEGGTIRWDPPIGACEGGTIPRISQSELAKVGPFQGSANRSLRRWEYSRDPPIGACE
eukprot:1054483-Prorocentrum_minimum.AAC.2